jgi:TolB-like protein/Flp pilus assembly protein TadD
MSQTRRLTAILAADVAGYSRLMGVDEEGTHERLKAHLVELVNPKIAERRGRIVKNTGDGFLAEFASVVDAVRCAAEVQRGMAERNADAPAEERIEFRIGINLGDVIVEEHDIFGDGVNVAARLEALAEPGGICVSRVARDQVRDRLDYAFEDLGEQSVKNITRPVRVYALRPEGTAGVRTPSVSSTVSGSPPVVAPRLSIVVLPFTNLSDDREQQYFTDGITEDLTTDLSRISGMFVISRNTAFTYRSKPADTKQIGRELGVRYVLEGSVRRVGQQLRVNAHLIDATTDVHLWTERFDHDTGDLFALQNEITSYLANALGVELIAAEAARPGEHPDTLDYILRGRAAGLKPYSRENQAEQISLFEHALALDPQSVEAQIRLANALVRRVLNGTTGEATGDLRRAEGLVGQALAAKSRSAYGHFVKGFVLHAQNRWQEAVPEFETALALDRNMVGALHELGASKVFTGSIDEVIPLVEQAIRLSPRDPDIGLRYFLIGTVHLLQSRTDEAIVWLEKARSAMPASPLNHSWLASAYALNGETEPAAAELAEAWKLDGGDLFSSIAHLKAHRWRSWGPKIRALFEATYFAGLRKAGIPEE